MIGMIGLVWDYDRSHVKIMAENIRKIIYFKDIFEFYDLCDKGMRIGVDVIFNNETNEILEFL